MLLRCILEAVTRRIIEENDLDKERGVDSLEKAINCLTKSKNHLSGTDKKILIDFRKNHWII